MVYRAVSMGFALPTVIITSVVMFAILTAAIGMVASVTTSLGTQYYEELATDAAESGSAQADSCLQANGYTSTWGSKNLTPATNCAGNVVSGQHSYIVSTPTYTSTYTVAPVTSSGTGTQTATITGTVNLTRSSGTVWRTYTKTLVVKTGGQIGTNQVVFGYSNSQGAFFGTVGGDGIMRTVGYNGMGQLGNGSYGSTLTPTQFQTPANVRIVAGYTSFLSLGYRMYALDSDGNAYGAGYNNSSSLGVGVSEATSGWIPSPRQVIIPATEKITSMVVGGENDYFLTSGNNIYAAGACTDGKLGSNYTISGCSDQATPVRVNLPAPNPSNPNTIPTSNIVTDRSSAYVRMAGGAVYGWGMGDLGQLGTETFADSANPVKIGTYGNSGQPEATQIAFDGDTLYILDTTGQVNSIGYNTFGQMGNDSMSLRLPYYTGYTNTCIDNAGADGVTIRTYTCNGTAAQKFELRTDGSIYNANKDVCLDNKGADGVTLRLYTCNGTAAQKFTWTPTLGKLYNPQSGKCVVAYSNTLQLDGCYPDNTTNYSNEWFKGYNSSPTPFDMSGFSGTVTKIWTDQWSLSCLTSNGEVWSAGLNSAGQFGNGTVANYQAVPVKFNMPVTAVDLYETNSTDAYQNLYAIGSNGKVYGAGANSFGQLGNGTTSTYSKTPVAMSVIDGSSIVASQVQSGYGTTVIFTTNGSVYTVGNNNSGQLGDGTTNNSSVPIKAKYVNNLKATTF